MFEPLHLSLTTPRPELPTSVWMSDLMPQLIFGGIIFFLSLSGFAITLILSPGWRVSLFFMLLTAAVGYWGLQIRQKVTQRQQIYQHGTPVSAQVMRHERAFNPLKSSRDYVAWLKIQGVDQAPIKVTHPRADLWTAAPKGETLTGLAHNGEYLFAEVLGRQFRLVEESR